MTENTTAAKARTEKPFSNQGRASERPTAEGTEAVREFAQQGAAYSKDAYEKTKEAAEKTNKAIAETYSTVAKGTAEFNQQWIEMVRANTNSALDFAGELFRMKSPSEFLELSASHARKQFETLTEQAQRLSGLAQKVTTDAVQPLQANVKNFQSR